MLTDAERLASVNAAVAARIRRVAQVGGKDPFLELGGPFAELQRILEGVASTVAAAATQPAASRQSMLDTQVRLLPDRLRELRNFMTDLGADDTTTYGWARQVVREAVDAIKALMLAYQHYDVAVSMAEEPAEGANPEAQMIFTRELAKAETYAQADLVGTRQ